MCRTKSINYLQFTFAPKRGLIFVVRVQPNLIKHGTIDDYAKDGGEELFTKMHCVL